MNTELLIKIIALALVLIFFLIRSFFVRHYKKFTPRTLIKYVIILALFYFYIAGYFDFAQLDFSLYYRLIAGLIIIFLGMYLLFWSNTHLGNNWSPIIEKKFSKSRKLIISGPYKYIRHPIYSASFITLTGFFILTSNWILLGIPFIILVLFYMFKIPREEKELTNNFGKKYLEYKKKVGGLFPR